MITTVTLNAAIDKTYYLPHFPLGKVSRVGQMYAAPGGKGINVARVIHQLGEVSLATGFIGGSNGLFIQAELDKQNIKHDFIKVEGESRLCLNIIDESNSSSTELLEPGPSITDQDAMALKQLVGKLAQKSSIVILSGSIPKGAKSTIYSELIDIAKSHDAKVFLDSSGDALLEGVKALPYLIKPNEHEVEQLIGKKLKQESDLYDSILQLVESGISCVAVSLGSKGSIAGFQGELYRIKAPKIDAMNTVGCGDSFMAGMAAALFKGASIPECLRLATAAGTANALSVQAGSINLTDIEQLLPLIIVDKILVS